ncbi:hypothetical protein IMZ48_45920, partial [Candidatus Bathyarchaeota archaeon]|nr:hypothetical protein [Candidatus Bathyarchaeota archaeon]
FRIETGSAAAEGSMARLLGRRRLEGDGIVGDKGSPAPWTSWRWKTGRWSPSDLRSVTPEP